MSSTRSGDDGTELEAIARQQEANTTGSAADKQREATELEEAAYLFVNTLAIWFQDQKDGQRAAQVELTQSGWRRLRGQQLLEKARLVRDLDETVLNGDQASEQQTTMSRRKNSRPSQKRLTIMRASSRHLSNRSPNGRHSPRSSRIAERPFSTFSGFAAGRCARREYHFRSSHTVAR